MAPGRPSPLGYSPRDLRWTEIAQAQAAPRLHVGVTRTIVIFERRCAQNQAGIVVSDIDQEEPVTDVRLRNAHIHYPVARPRPLRTDDGDDDPLEVLARCRFDDTGGIELGERLIPVAPCLVASVLAGAGPLEDGDDLRDLV